MHIADFTAPDALWFFNTAIALENCTGSMCYAVLDALPFNCHCFSVIFWLTMVILVSFESYWHIVSICHEFRA